MLPVASSSASRRSSRMTAAFLAIVLLVGILIAWTGTRFAKLKTISHQQFGDYRASLKNAAQSSIHASQSINLPLALVHAAKAVALTEDVIERFGCKNAQEYLHVDVDHLHKAFKNQLNTIIESMYAEAPALAPEHPFGRTAEWFDPATDDNDVRHRDEEMEEEKDDASHHINVSDQRDRPMRRRRRQYEVKEFRRSK